MTFREDFAWGVATAAYQIEGAPLEDGKGASTWDMFTRKPGAIWNGQTGDVACDHYHRWQEDIAIMRGMGLKHYRLSLSWPRVMPDGAGRVNPAGLAFYDRLIDGLLEAGITPWVTLFHWDFPHALYLRGSWLNADSPRWFGEYAAVVGAALGDRVTRWFTINEPQVFLQLGYGDGTHAPGDRLAFREVLLAAHHVLLAHGRAVQALRASCRTPGQIGYACFAGPSIPATRTPDDVEVARRRMFEVHARNLWSVSWFSDPVFFGRYPDDGVALYGADMPAIGAEDMATIRQPLDLFGVNIYQGDTVRAVDGSAQVVPMRLGDPLTMYGWQITPEALYWGPRFVAERYGKPVVVSENGVATLDLIDDDGRVHDPQRITYTRRYLSALRRAAADGVDVRGYFHWSLMDNFEWAEGVRTRFGLVYVDFPTGRRILKDSAFWYSDVIAGNGEGL
jgi:beta-glucosidase